MGFKSERGLGFASDGHSFQIDLMRDFKARFIFAIAGFLTLCRPVCAQVAASSPIRVKVVVVTMFERGEDTGDIPGEYQLWVEREHLDQVIPLPAGYHHVRMNKDGVLGMVTGVGTAKAAASVMALGLDPRFDFSRAYWIVAGIGGGDPNDVSAGSAVWADHIVDGDLAFEIDARQIPQDWPTGYVPLRKGTPYELPANDEYGEVYTLNWGLVGWAFSADERCGTRRLRDVAKIAGTVRGLSQCVEAAIRGPGRCDGIEHVLAWLKDGRLGQRVDGLLRRGRGKLHGFRHGRLWHAPGSHILESSRARGFAAGSGAAHGEQL